MIALKTLMFTVLVPGTVLLYVPHELRSLSSNLPTFDIGAWRYIGLLPFILGFAMYFWCAFDFTFKGRGTPAPIDPPKHFVAEGLYRFVRNPMYVGALLIIVGQFLFFQALVLVFYAAFLFAGFHAFVVFYEEPTLKRKFGSTYVDYNTIVPRWIPRRRPLPKSHLAALTRRCT